MFIHECIKVISPGSTESVHLSFAAFKASQTVLSGILNMTERISKVNSKLTAHTVFQYVRSFLKFFGSIDFVNPLYTGRLFYCYKLDETNCYFRGDGSVVSLLFYF